MYGLIVEREIRSPKSCVIRAGPRLLDEATRVADTDLPVLRVVDRNPVLARAPHATRSTSPIDLERRMRIGNILRRSEDILPRLRPDVAGIVHPLLVVL